MDDPTGSTEASMQEHHFVKADEVDQTGTDISPVSDDQLMEEVVEGLRQEQASQSTSAAANEANEAPPQVEKVARRPELRRDVAAPPPPPLQPPPPAPVQQNSERPPDSLSLAQLRQLVQEMPKIEQPAYAFEYADSQPFEEEIEEWFQYSEFDRAMLLGMRSSFEQKWTAFGGSHEIGSNVSWTEASDAQRKSFISQVISRLRDREILVRIEALEILLSLIHI